MSTVLSPFVKTEKAGYIIGLLLNFLAIYSVAEALSLLVALTASNQRANITTVVGAGNTGFATSRRSYSTLLASFICTFVCRIVEAN